MYLAENLKFLREQNGKTQGELAVLFGIEQKTIGKWAFHLAYIERGYKAVGGEYLLIPVVYWGAWKAINYLFDSLEELENERNCRKKRSRGTARMRNYR